MRTETISNRQDRIQPYRTKMYEHRNYFAQKTTAQKIDEYRSTAEGLSVAAITSLEIARVITRMVVQPQVPEDSFDYLLWNHVGNVMPGYVLTWAVYQTLSRKFKVKENIGLFAANMLSASVVASFENLPIPGSEVKDIPAGIAGSLVYTGFNLATKYWARKKYPV